MNKTTRRGFFTRISDGLYGTALATVLSGDIYGSLSPLLANETDSGLPEGHRRSYDLAARPRHFPAKAKAVIHLYMNGGPSQVDLFDPKPALEKHNGETYDTAGGQADVDHSGKLMRSPFAFKQYGKSGAWVSELMPHIAKHVDDIALIRSMQTVHFNHEQALFMIHSGRPIPGRPSMGSWVVFGLGTENQNLPAYVVLDDPLGLPINANWNWQNGFLPPLYQGTRLRSVGSPILDLQPDFDKSAEMMKAERDLISRLDQVHKRSHPNELQLDARIASYDLAARLQLEASDALDIGKESAATREMYGIGADPTDSYGRRCLMARRLVERGVRFVQIYINGQIWDNHSSLEAGMRDASQRTDKPAAALLADLKQRGLLDNTLVIWGGEFGRSPIAQVDAGPAAGRDHNPKGFSLWMAGGGVKPGVIYGATDEIGYEAVENKVSVTDWHATILHLLGLDYQKLVFDQSGLKDRLTSVFEARVVKEILA
ncbi:MAG: DUF1501 domain-containing protein [Bryobacteraceae bacterium]